MNEATVGALAKKVTGWSIAISILMIIAGLLAILLPLEAGIAVNLFVGWMLMFTAAAHFVYAWSTRHSGGVIWKVLLGILYAVIAFYLLEHPARGLATLTLVLAYYLLIEGVMEIVLFFQHRSAPGSIWFLFDGIITLILGVLVWKTWPNSTEWVIGTLVGLSILFSGTTRLMLSLAARRVATKMA
ncbi:MAG TPA: HdeD family acid-resistance protein [Candidatus Acidoferrum sp.]|nr:HdeD family acid-resistance protein [Candidatus Acidoferrum sp.]